MIAGQGSTPANGVNYQEFPTPTNQARQAERLFMKVKLHRAAPWHSMASNFPGQFPLAITEKLERNYPMKKLALIAATAGSLALSAVAAPAEARGPAIAGGLIAGAVIGGIASNAYGYGPGYGYYGGYPPNLKFGLG